MALLNGLLRLGDIIAGVVIGRWHENYKEKLEAYWNKVLHSYRPLAFVEVESGNDIVATIKFCTLNKLPMCVRYGDYESSTSCCCDDAVIIDLSRMKKVKVHKRKQIAVLDMGASLSDVEEKMCDKELITSFGASQEQTVGGQALNFSIGFLTRRFGMLMDNIIEYHLVDVRGYQMTVNRDTNLELFWGMKMYGANFGVVTKLIIKLNHMSEDVLGGDFFCSWNDAVPLVKFMRELLQTRSLPNELSLTVYLQIYNSGFRVIMRFLHSGDVKLGLNWFQTLKELCPVDVSENNVKIHPYCTFRERLFDMFPEGHYCKIHPMQFVKELSDEYIDTVIDAFSRLSPDEHCHSVFEFTILGGVMRNLPADSTPFPFREANYFTCMTGMAKTKGGYRELFGICNDLASDLRSYNMVLNKSNYSATLERLKALKCTHDPQNCFRYNKFKIDFQKL